MPQVVVRDLRKQYGGVPAVNGVSFEVAAGEIFGLLGPNGAGKTTTVECLIGLRDPDGGTVEIGGIDARLRPRLPQLLDECLPQQRFVLGDQARGDDLSHGAAPPPDPAR